MFFSGSEGPGRIPKSIVFSLLYQTEHGKFKTVRYIAPVEDVVCLYGWNQSMFTMKAYTLGEAKKGWPLIY